ncbi:unnamed protein product [Arctia plantaginis]|uniref:Uncharacterized protein n=1 Tax=Arctia plantaginis TaxID=874455 RepID=A0A8S0YY89_ARCPL|nr:unnamed protein product [Arctia plantaginis]
MDMDGIYTEKRQPRKIMKVNDIYKHSEYVQVNRKYWKSVIEGLDSCNKSASDESKVLAEVLPDDLYQKVCNTLKIPLKPIHQEEKNCVKVKSPRRRVKEPQISHRKCLYIDKELDSDTDVEYTPSDDDEKPNIHQELLSKPEREQITWDTHYLQPEREDEKSLVKKANDLTDRIANEFCEYMKQLGGDQQSQLFTPKAIKELFQIEFDTHVAQSLRVEPKELPCVHDKVCNVIGHPQKSRTAALERQITKDIRAQERKDLVTAFGQSLPMKDQYHGPKNNTKEMWRSARHVPNDLVTLKTVWEGITNLRSVKEYCRWMIDHPEHRRAPYLTSLGLFDPAVLEARLTFEAECNFTPPAVTPHDILDTATPIDLLHRKLSELAES